MTEKPHHHLVRGVMRRLDTEALADRLEAVVQLLEDNGCDCTCDHHWEECDEECDPPCLACRINTALFM